MKDKELLKMLKDEGRIIEKRASNLTFDHKIDVVAQKAVTKKKFNLKIAATAVCGVLILALTVGALILPMSENTSSAFYVSINVNPSIALEGSEGNGYRT